MWPGPGEDLCFLSGDWRILQRLDGHRWTLDDLVTAWWAGRIVGSPPARAIDLGCGIGTVLLLVAWRFPSARVVGVEAQEMSVALARRSIAFNGAGDRCEVHHGDLREPERLVAMGPADLVTGTPPYFPEGTGSESSRPQCGPCRFEHRGGAEVYAQAAAAVLAPGAPFVACAPAGHRERVAAAAEACGLALETWREVVSREGRPPRIAVYSMRHAEAARSVPPESPIVVRNRAGRWTAGFVKLRAEMGMPALDAVPEDAGSGSRG